MTKIDSTLTQNTILQSIRTHTSSIIITFFIVRMIKKAMKRMKRISLKQLLNNYIFSLYCYVLINRQLLLQVIGKCYCQRIDCRIAAFCTFPLY